jgi:hypothetical protein
MVLPERMGRETVRQGYHDGTLTHLDALVRGMTDNSVTDYSVHNARALRRAVSRIFLDESDGVRTKGFSRQAWLWRAFLHRTPIATGPARRIAAPSPYKFRKGSFDSRLQAADSREVAELLGPELLRSLTPASEAAAMRQKAYPHRVQAKARYKSTRS